MAPADNANRPALSVIVLIYNVEKYLRRALDSLKVQKMENAEFILMDDCSTDSSGSIALEYVRSDPRFRYIRHEKNMSMIMGRKHGILAARGDYIMFLDGDDYYSDDTCNVMYQYASNDAVDILRFTAEVFSDGPEQKSIPEHLPIYVNTYPSRMALTGEEQFRELIVSYCRIVWNKVYRRELLLKAAEHIPDTYINMCEDEFFSFICGYFAESCASVDYLGYHYRYGSGIATKQQLTTKELESYCGTTNIIRILNTFLDEQHAGPASREALGIQKDRMLKACLRACFRKLPPNLRGTGCKMITEAWGARGIIASLYEDYRDNISFLNDSMAIELGNSAAGEIRSIAVMLSDAQSGSDIKAASGLVRALSLTGRCVTLITGGANAELPGGVKRISVPAKCAFSIEERLDGLKAALENIDLLIYCGGEDPIAVYDILFAGSLGVKTVLSVRSAGIFTMSRLTRMPLALIAAARSADCVVVHGNMNREFLGAFNGNTVYINERIDSEKIESTPFSSPGGNDILLFVSDDIAGGADDITALVKTLLVQSRDTRIIVIGDHSGSYSRALGGEQSVKSHPGRVVFAEGGVSEYWESAAVTVYPDETDGLPEILIESGAHGVPVVTYGLPYSELRRDFMSIINVPGRDTLSMVSEILKLISDKERASNLGKAFRAELIEFAKAPVEDKWRELIRTLESGRSAAPANEPSTLLIKTIVSQYELAVSKIDDDTIHAALYTFAHLNSAIDGKPAYCQVYDGQRDARVVSFRVASISSATGETTDSYDVFQLPAVEPDMPKSRFDRILTTRDAVKISEGGTGASNARDALRNLGAYPLISGEALGTGLDECVQAGAYSCARRDKEYESGIFPVKGAFKLVVEQLTGGVVKQTAISAESGEVFFRTGKNGIWNSWKHFAIAESTDSELRRINSTLISLRDNADAADARLKALYDRLNAADAELKAARSELKESDKRTEKALKARDKRISRLEGELEQTRNIWLLRLLRRISGILHKNR